MECFLHYIRGIRDFQYYGIKSMQHLVGPYKGYTGTYQYNKDDKLYFGKLNIPNDYIMFQGTTIAEIKADFNEAVDCYLEFCAKVKKTPETNLT